LIAALGFRFLPSAVLVVLAGGAFAAQAPSLSLRDVLARLDAYLATYESTLATVVAEEHYTQSVESSSRGDRRTRTLISDYALARSPGGHAWTGFRDTFEVDGGSVRDRANRLQALMAEGSAESARQALRISRDNAQYNLGEEVVARTINVPTVALDLIHPRHRSRLSVEPRGEEMVDGVRALVLAFRERDRPTILRTPDGKDRRARGAVWVDSTNGEVLRTDLSWDGRPDGYIVVHYRRDEGIGALVPETMLEEYRGARGVVTGKATYTNYRRFQTAARVITSPDR
jgi:hypothetical protein